jgi:cytochrome c biogenesis factor
MWTSVHAWSETEVGFILMGTIIATLVLSGLVIGRAYLLKSRRIWYGQYIESRLKNPDHMLMVGTVITFVILTSVTFYVLMITMGKIDPDAYEVRLTPFVVVLMIVLSICLCWRYFGKENSLYIIAWTLLASTVCAVILPMYVFPGDAEEFYSILNAHHIVGFMIPFVILTCFASIFKMIKVINLKSLRNSIKSLSPHLIHLGVAFIILGYLASQTMIIENTQRVALNGEMEVGGYTINVTKIELKENTGDLDSNEYWDTWYVTIEIYQNGQLIETGKLNIVYRYYWEGNIKRYSMIMSSEVYVGSMAFEDLYISIKGISPGEVNLDAQVIPLMTVLWSGMWLFIAGIILRVGVDYIPVKLKPVRSVDQLRESAGHPEIKLYRGKLPRGPPGRPTSRRSTRAKAKSKPKPKKDYERMLEDELKKLRS